MLKESQKKAKSGSSTEEEPIAVSKLQLIGAAGLVWVNRLLLGAGLRKRVDGWRRGASVSLTQETTRFVLSAFSLDVLGSEAGDGERERLLARRLAEFLEREKEFHCCVEVGENEHRVRVCEGAGCTLAFEPWVEGAGRFVRPDGWEGDGRFEISNLRFEKGIELPVMEFVARIAADGRVDLWARVNHVAVDGVPAQEMMSRLEKAWGVREEVVFPIGEEFAAFEGPRDTPGREGAAEVQTFVDFSALLAWRKKWNEKLVEPMTVSAAILWWLAKLRGFERMYMGTTVEVGAVDGLGRGVGVVVVRPGDYFGRAGGGERYVAKFNREVDLTRRRKSASCKTLDAAAHLPAGLEKAVLKFGLEQGTTAFGRVGLTILKDAKVFGAPLGDAGHRDGFIAIGGIALKAREEKRVGCVVVKGDREKIAEMARVIREVMEGVE